MHVLIIGLGDTGRRLATNLVAQGHQVTGLSRHVQHIAEVRHLAQTVHQVNLQQLPPIDWVYVMLSPDDRTGQGYSHTFIDSILPLYHALDSHPVQRIVFISSTSVYGQGQGEWVDEQTAVQPVTPTAKILWQAEQQWRDSWQDKLTVIRPSGIYGPGRFRLINWVKAGRPVQGNHWTNRIHVDDLAGWLACLTKACHIADLYILTDQLPCLQDEVLDYIAHLLQRPLLTRQAATPSGKRLRSLHMQQISYLLLFPDYQQGYKQLLNE